MTAQTLSKRHKRVNYSKWGYFFIIPFFATYAIFSLYPLIYTFYISFFENYKKMTRVIGPNFVGLDNYKKIFDGGMDSTLMHSFSSTLIIWLMGFIPQIFVALLFASWFTDLRLKLKATGIFKVIIYLPNIIMASSIAVLFNALFLDGGPADALARLITGDGELMLSIFRKEGTTRGVVSFINFLMWYGNTTILLMAAIMGIDTSLYESSQIDGASSGQTFRKITLPLIKPILLFVVVTSLIGGIQMFDVPQLLSTAGGPNNSTKTMVMYIYSTLTNKNYGLAGATSVVLFAVSAALSLVVFYMLREKGQKKLKSDRKGGK